MKLPKLISIFLVLFLSVQICFGQQNLKSELFDIFGKSGNDDLLARMDPFFLNVLKTNSTGYIIIHGTKNNPLDKYIYERKLKGCFQSRRIPDKSFIFAIAENKEKLTVELWSTPINAEKPQLTETERNFDLTGMMHQQIVSDKSWEDDYCPLHFDTKFYSQFLKANPNIIGKIVIEGRNLNDFNKVRQNYLKQLTQANKIPRRQIKFIKAKYAYSGNVEFWLVPKK